MHIPTKPTIAFPFQQYLLDQMTRVQLERNFLFGLHTQRQFGSLKKKLLVKLFCTLVQKKLPD